jgi:hypothetical protein
MSVVAAAATDRLGGRSGAPLVETARLIVGDVSTSVARNLVRRRHQPLFRFDLAVALIPTEVPTGGSVDVAVAARSPLAGVWLQSSAGLTELTLNEVPGTADHDWWGHPLCARSHPVGGDDVLVLANPLFLRADQAELHSFFDDLWMGVPRPIEFLHRATTRPTGPIGDRAVVAIWPGHYEERATA